MFRKVHKQAGFTIVELLIVIVVIGVLAAITIVAFNGVQQRAGLATLQSDLRNAATALEIAKTDNSDQYPDNANALSASEGTSFQYTSDGSSYCLSGTSDRDGVPAHSISSANPTVTEGLCPGHSEGGVATASAVATGYDHSCAIYDTGIYCWGSGTYGQLGNGSTDPQDTPTAVDMSGVLSGKTPSAITAGARHTCAIADGEAFCWGADTGGQLGNGATTGQQDSPVAVSTAGVLAGKTVTAISAGDYYTCAVADGEAFCWGGNGYGELGTGSYSYAESPTAVSTAGVLSGKTVTAISGGNSDTCAVADGEAFCWGAGFNGSLGDGGSEYQIEPVAVSTAGVLNGKTVTAISTANGHSCAVADGEAFCWGIDTSGQLGNGATTGQQTTPVAVSTSGVLSGRTVSQVHTGPSYTCAIADGQAFCWGAVNYSQLGTAHVTSQTSPVAVTVTESNALSAISSAQTVQQISARRYHTCAVTAGAVSCWGDSANGKLGATGVSGTGSYAYPVAVDQP